MKMTRVGKIIQVEILPAQLCNGSHIGQDIPPLLMMQDYRKAGGCLACGYANFGDVDATLAQSFERDSAERIISNARLKSHAASERRQIMGDDC